MALKSFEISSCCVLVGGAAVSAATKSPWRRKKMAPVPAVAPADLFDLSDWYPTAKQHPHITTSTPSYKVAGFGTEGDTGLNST